MTVKTFVITNCQVYYVSQSPRESLPNASRRFTQNWAIFWTTTYFSEQFSLSTLHFCVTIDTKHVTALTSGMTTWFSLSMETTLLSIAWSPLLILAFYCAMDKKHSKDAKTTSRPDISYAPVDATNNEELDRLTHKLELVWKNMPLACSLFVVMFCRNVLPQAVVTTLVFPDAPFRPRDHYQYYVCASVFGEVVGKSYGLLVLGMRCRLPQYTERTWVFAILAVACTIFLSFEAWFRFLPHVWVVIFICFVVGLCAGLTFDFTFAAAPGEPSSGSKEFSRSILVFPLAFGLLTASLLGFVVEPFFHKRCLNTHRNSTHCLTRTMW